MLHTLMIRAASNEYSLVLLLCSVTITMEAWWPLKILLALVGTNMLQKHTVPSLAPVARTCLSSSNVKHTTPCK